MSIDIQHVSKSFGSFAALRDVSFEVRAGELVALLGPSGCGKTTLLRIVAGLETADRGTVMFDGEDAAGRKAGERRGGVFFPPNTPFPPPQGSSKDPLGLSRPPRPGGPPQNAGCSAEDARAQQVVRR